VIAVTACLLGTALAAAGLVTGDAAVLGLLVLVGASRALFDVASRSLLQRGVTADMVARIFGLTEGLSMAGLAVGSLLVPLLVALGGGRLALLGVAVIVPLVVLLSLRLVLRLDEQASVPVVEISLLRSTPVFRSLPGPALEGVARALRRVDFEPGTVIISENDDAGDYFTIADGKVQIQQNGRRIGELERGSGMGEIALLRGGPRTATAVALTPVTAYSLDRDSFLTSVLGHASSASAAYAVADEHVQRDAKRAERPPDDDDG
jgi:MFS family permease